MDDRTVPSAHVRHNFEGLALAFPPAYLLSFVLNSEAEPLRGGNDFAHIARSRMPGIFGVTYQYQELDAELSGAIRLSIDQYKALRDTVAQAYAVLLSRQASSGVDWDIVEEIAENARSAVVFAFKGDDSDGRVLVTPRNLNPEGLYRVRSLDAGDVGSATGEELMRDGIEIVHLGGSRAHVIILNEVLQAF